jgi:hypothetical protein
MYLAYLVIDTLGTVNVEAKVTYTDKSIDSMSFAMATKTPNKIYYIPAGAKQLDLDQLQPAKTIWYWEITVKETGAVSETFKYVSDNRQDYNDITINYRNSIGGLDSLRIRGTIQYDLDYEFQEQAKTVRPNYFDGHFFDPQSIISNNKELQTLRGDIGHLDVDEQDRLRDAFLIREVWWEISKKWWPLKIINKNIKQKTTEDNLWHLPLDFTLAHEGDYYYTPDLVDLGTGTFTSNVCQAYLSPITISVDLSGSDASVTFSGIENDPQSASTTFQYRIVKVDGTEEITWTTLAYSALPIVLHLPKDVIDTLETRAICSNQIFGKIASKTIDTHAGGGTPPTTFNSIIKDLSTSPLTYSLKVNGTIITSGALGSFDSEEFNANEALGATVNLTLTGYSPPLVTLISNGVSYTGRKIIGSTGYNFLNVDIVGGMEIRIG